MSVVWRFYAAGSLRAFGLCGAVIGSVDLLPPLKGCLRCVLIVLVCALSAE